MPPPNLTPETAMVVTANETVTVDVSGATAPDFTVWFKYTTHPGEILISVYAHAPVASTYGPRFSIWTGDPPALVSYDMISVTSKVNRPKLIPVTLVAVPSNFYFQVTQSNAGVTPTVPLEFTVASNARASVPAGSWLVSSDGVHFPLIALSNTSGTMYGHKTFVEGEGGVQLANGVAAHTNKVTNGLTVYGADFSVLAEIPSSTVQTNSSSFVATDRTSRFYVNYAGTAGVADAKIYIVNSSGAVINTLTFTGRVTKPAVRRDNTILYFLQAETVVKRWDLVNGVFLADLYTPPANHALKADIVVLADDSIVLAIRQNVAPYAETIVRLNDSGATLNTIPLDGGQGLTPGEFLLNRMAYAYTDNHLIVWEKDYAATHRFRELVAATGAEVSRVSLDGFDVNGDASKTPYDGMALYGSQQSCPIFVTMVPFETDAPTPVPMPPYVAPSYRLDARSIRRLRRAPHVANENVRIFYRKFELDLERGVGLVTGQGSDPEVMVRLSRDGGHTWGEPMRMSAGRMGEYTTRVIARRLGQARDTVFEVTVSDPVAWSLVQAWLDLEAGTS
jgi:hypothetical protein